MSEFDLVPKEIFLSPYTIDNSYEYAEMRFTEVFKSILMENSKLFPTMSPDDPRYQKTKQTITYYDSLAEQGWECFEIVHVSSFVGEIRRFRRKKSV